MCKLFNWTRSTMSGSGQNILLGFLGRRKDLCLPKHICVSLSTYGNTWGGQSRVSLFFPVPLAIARLPRQADPVRRHLVTEESENRCHHLLWLWWTQLPNNNNFKNWISLKRSYDTGIWQSCWLISDTERPSSLSHTLNQQSPKCLVSLF